MAHRLQMKLGIVPEAERLPDSPDTAIHVEPRVGAQTRTKGHLYLLVTSKVPGARAREATRLVADSIRSEYYYDESAGIRVCLVKAIIAANKRLTHARERGALGNAQGAIGVGIAVVRDNELYVCTVGPAEAYLNRGARLSTLPDPHRDRGLPATELVPDVWRGEIGVGDQLMLVSPNVAGALGPDVLKDALVTLHPQSAAEHLSSRFRGTGGTGSDGVLIIEAAEIAVSRAGVAPIPVRPAEPLAGVPDRSPIPLADSVAGGVAAAQSGARWARVTAGTAVGRLIMRIQDAMPARGVGNRRVTALSARREMQRRAAVAILSLVVVIAGLGAAVFALGGRQPAGQVIASMEVGQAAFETAKADLDRVIGPGIDLVANDPTKAERLLSEAMTSLDAAADANIPSSTIDPVRTKVVAALDRLYRMSDVSESSIFEFPADQQVDLKALVRGPDGAPFVLDAKTQSVYRIDLAGRKASVIFRAGNKPRGGTEAEPRLLAVGGRDLLMLDSKNQLWRWRPANSTGKGTVTRVQPVVGSSEWGNDILAIGTFVRQESTGLYNLYVVDPSKQQVLRYSPAADGGGFPGSPTPWLSAARDVSGITSIYIDGEIFVTDRGDLLRYANGKSEGWTAESPGDEVLRPTPDYTLVTSGAPRRAGQIYAFDKTSDRVIAFQKATGKYVGQYRLAGGATDWQGLRDWYVEPGVAEGDPDTLIWLDATGLHRTVLQGTAGEPGASSGPNASGSPAASGVAASPAPTK